MEAVFYTAAFVAILSTALAVSRANAVHGLLYFAVSLLAVAVMFYALGAPFGAALEVIIYAGAIVVLFIFVVMMLNLGSVDVAEESRWIRPRIWIGPALLSAVLLAELLWLLFSGPGLGESGAVVVGAKEVGATLFGPYLLAVELASMLLLAALVGAYHLGRQQAEGGV